jgi:plastocyanin
MSAACVIFAAGSMPATAPMAAPATRPACGVIRGRVSLSGGWALQKPDLTRVVVYLASDANLDKIPAATTQATVAQKNKAFVPNFIAVPLGTSVEFPNWDNFDHNVFSKSKAAPAFDLDRYPRGKSKTRVFEKTGVVQIYCNIHPQMRAIVYVTPNRFLTRADADGNFEIAGVPDGRFDLIAWNDRCEEQRRSVTVNGGEPVNVSFDLKESRERALSSAGNDRRGGYGLERGLGIKREKLNLPVVTESHPATQPESP